MTRIPVAEAAVKKMVQDRLQFLQNQGKCWFVRVNSGGNIVEGKNGKRYMIRNAPAGTADFLVILHCKRMQELKGVFPPISIELEWPTVIFIEAKSSDGVQSPEQLAFQKQVEALGCEYQVVRTPEELEEVLK